MKISTLYRVLPITSASTDGTTLTVNTPAHNLVTGDKVLFNSGPTTYTCITAGATAFQVPNIVVQAKNYIPTGTLYIQELRVAASVSNSIVVPSDHTKVTFQIVGSTTAGVGAVAVDIQVSNNNIDWLLYSTISLVLGTTVTTEGIAIDAPWGYFRSKISSISGTNAKVVTHIGY